MRITYGHDPQQLAAGSFNAGCRAGGDPDRATKCNRSYYIKEIRKEVKRSERVFSGYLF
jgi:hypothetical protein